MLRRLLQPRLSAAEPVSLDMARSTRPGTPQATHLKAHLQTYRIQTVRRTGGCHAPLPALTANLLLHTREPVT